MIVLVGIWLCLNCRIPPPVMIPKIATTVNCRAVKRWPVTSCDKHRSRARNKKGGLHKHFNSTEPGPMTTVEDETMKSRQDSNIGNIASWFCCAPFSDIVSRVRWPQRIGSWYTVWVWAWHNCSASHDNPLNWTPKIRRLWSLLR